MEPIRRSKSRRRYWRVAAAVSIFLLALVLSLPFWMPWVAGPVLRRQGVAYSTYERVGYGRFALTGVRVHKRGIRFSAERVEAYQPVAWLWRLGVGGGNPFVEVTGWEALGVSVSTTSKRGKSVYEIYRKAEPIVQAVERWLPRAEFKNGLLELRDQAVAVQRVEWKGGAISGALVLSRYDQQATFQGDTRGIKWLVLSSETAGILSTNQVRVTGEGVELMGTVFWKSNRADLMARFGREGRLPQEARVRADRIRIPASVHRAAAYGDLEGQMTFAWGGTDYTFQLSATGKPVDERFPELQTEVRARGDTNSVWIERARVHAPAASFELSNPVQLSWAGPMFSTQAVVSVNADLSQQPWVNLTGYLSGQAMITPGTNRFPKVTFNLLGAQIGRYALNAETFSLKGVFDWPRLKVDQVDAQFADGGSADASATIDLGQKKVEEAAFGLRGAVGKQLLPAEVDYRGLGLELKASGPWTNLSHSGRLSVRRLIWPKVQPLGGQVEWQGVGRSLTGFDGTITAGGSELIVGGAGRMSGGVAQGDGGGAVEIQLRELGLRRGGSEVLRLQSPARLKVERGDVKAVGNWRFWVEEFDWGAGDRQLALNGKMEWPWRSAIDLRMRNLTADLFQDFSTAKFPAVQVEHFNLKGGSTNGPLVFTMDAAGRFKPENSEESFRAILQAGAGESGLEVKQAIVQSKEQTIVTLRGMIPLTMDLREGWRAQVRTNELVRLEARTEPNDAFWNSLSMRAGVRVENPRAKVEISGTLHDPSGMISLEIPVIRLRTNEQGAATLPMEKVQLMARLNRRQLELREFSILIAGESVMASGVLPLGTNYSSFKNLLLWERATGRLQVPKAEIAKVAAFFPRYLSPEGTIELDVSMEQGKRWRGSALVAGAALRPQMPIGSIRDVQARLEFRERQVLMENITAELGGERLILSGAVDLDRQFENGMPLIELRLRGTNVPLARKPEVVLRTDLDLTVSNATNGQPAIFGVVNLRESLLMRDLGDLVPGKIAAPKRRPPYFSIDMEPLRSWPVRVQVRGDEFLQVRSPIFRGKASAHLQVEGTLGEPVALGEARINSGVVQFPFANLNVTQGLISLTADNPFEPQLFVVAGARVYGYEVKMDAHGPASKPVVEFTATPSLSSEQIVMMLTTGRLPSEGQRFSSGQRVARLGFFLGKNVLSKLGSGEGTGDRLTIRTGETVTEEGKETYSAEYRLNKSWSVVGEYGRFNDFNLGFKWKVYSK